MDVPSRSRMGPARGAGPAGGATVEGDGLACGSGSRDSRRTLHAGRRDGGGRDLRQHYCRDVTVEHEAARDVRSRAAAAT